MTLLTALSRVIGRGYPSQLFAEECNAMMTNRSTLFAAVLSLTAASTAAADKLEIEPGLWKTTTTATMPFGQGEHTQTSEECVTDTEFDPATMMEDAEGCELTHSSVDGNRLEFGMTCDVEGGTSTMEGSYEVDGDEGRGVMTMSMNMQGMTMEMEMSFTSERVGDC